MAYPVAFTDQQIADRLTEDGFHFTRSSLTFSFNDYSTAGNALGETQKAHVRTALAMLEEILAIDFVETAGGGDLSYSGSRDAGTYTSYSYNTATREIISPDIYFDQSWVSNQAGNLYTGSYGYMTILHETLHALGLGHPGDYNGGSPTYMTDAEFRQDTHRYTVMSYFDAYNDGSGSVFYDIANGRWVSPQTPMVYDILALSQGSFGGYFGGYALNTVTRAGATTYGYNAGAGINPLFNFSSNTAPVLTIHDGGGTDTLDLSGDTVSQRVVINYDGAGNPASYSLAGRTTTVIDLREGGYSSTHGMTNNIGIAFGTTIENAIGTQFADTIYGNAAANTLYGGGGNDILLGGGGQDRADFSGLFRTYGVGGNLAERSVSSAAEGYDILRSVEIAAFVDGKLISDVTSDAAIVYRMYDAAFNRLPDALGLNNWIASLSNGMTTTGLAAQFLTSQEFTRAYGSLNNSDFVRQLYKFVLDREPDQAGHQYWTAGLDGGSLGRTDILVGFSESPEHIEMLRGPVETGIWDINENAAAAARLYYVALDRSPDATGLLGWKRTLDSGTPLADVADQFVFSPEFQNRYGALSNSDFGEQLYINALDRMPEAAGLAGWTNALDGGMERGDVLVGFSESYEHQIKTLPLIDHGIFVA